MINGTINGRYKVTSAKLDIKAKEIGLSIWKARHIWLYVILIPSIPASYIFMRKFFIGVMEQGLWLSNLTANFFVLIVVWLWYNQDISTALYNKIRHKNVKRAPVWIQAISLFAMIFGLMTYLSFWGYETVW